MATSHRNLSLVELHEHVHTALSHWTSGTNENPLDYLLLFQIARNEKQGSERNVVNGILLNAIEELERENQEYATILRLRFLEGMPAHIVGNRRSEAVSTISRKQREAIAALVKIIYLQEEKVRTVYHARFADRLEPPTYESLFGVDEHLDALTALLAKKDGAWLISLEGMGGIGKTSLADALMRQEIEQTNFQAFAWVTARQKRLHLSGEIRPMPNEPALTANELIHDLAKQLLSDVALPISFDAQKVQPILQERLKRVPHLIVADNLETVEDIDALLPLLRTLAKPTKFILTTRESLYAEPGIYPFKIPSLSQYYALQLIRHEGQVNNLPAVLDSTDDELLPIYETVGGNPLALRLVVGQLHIHNLATVLNALKKAQGHSVRELYTYIYRQAWDDLKEAARSVLLSTPLLPETGGTFEYLSANNGLDESEFLDALQTLVVRNLVDHHRGKGLNDDRYSIHNLTKSFLIEQVLQWNA